MRGKVKRVGKAEGAERCTRNKVQLCLTEVYKQALVEPGDALLQYPSLTDKFSFSETGCLSLECPSTLTSVGADLAMYIISIVHTTGYSDTMI